MVNFITHIRESTIFALIPTGSPSLLLAYRYIELDDNTKTQRGKNVDHGINVDQSKVQIQYTVFALISWIRVLIYIKSMICINYSVRKAMNHEAI
jgi:hypothetical protein